jgi:acetyl esterase/lipase
VNQQLVERLDPELSGVVKMMMNQPPMSFDDLPAARAGSDKMTAALKNLMPDIPGVISEDRKIPGCEGAPDITVRIYRPEKRAGILPALLWIHGGGYMLGTLDQEDWVAKPFSLKGDCVTLSVDYRLAPEHPYPAPLEDCYTALEWLASHTQELGIDRTRIAVGGASAGGGLASGLALLARDRAKIDIKFQLLVYPMINDCNIVPAGDNLPDALFWTRAANLKGWRSYLGCEPGGKDISCYASAFRATDLKNLPPAYIAVGDLEFIRPGGYRICPETDRGWCSHRAPCLSGSLPCL